MANDENSPDQWRNTTENLETSKVLGAVLIIGDKPDDSEYKGSGQ
jgi:hypothetical protein